MKKELLRKIFGDWYAVLLPLLVSDYFKNLTDRVASFYKTKESIYPKQSEIFKAFSLTKYKDVRVVILGDGPISNNNSNGLAWGIKNDSLVTPSSLRNIWGSVEIDYYNGMIIDFDVTLESWAKQGVLLLNAGLTSQNCINGNHSEQWRLFTRGVLHLLSMKNPGLIYCLWGDKAQSYEDCINKSNHIIKADHPTTLSKDTLQWNFSFKEIDKLTTKLNGDKIKW